MGFDIPKGKISARQAATLNKVRDELPSTSRINDASDIELDPLIGSVQDSTEDLISLTRQQSIDH